jgi:hypothetical protein
MMMMKMMMMMTITNTPFSVRRFGNYVFLSLASATRRYHPRHAVCTKVLMTARRGAREGKARTSN